jgi:hypothetical protein
MVQQRSLVGFIILSIITFGLYGLYWIYKLAKDVNLMCEGDGKNTGGLFKCIFFGIITLSIYNFVWLYMLGDRLQENAPKYNLAFKEGGGAVLLWYVVGSIIVIGPLIATYIIIKNTNALAREFNKKVPQ